MSRWTPCKRSEFIRRLRRLGFRGLFSGTRHQFMVHAEHRLAVPRVCPISPFFDNSEVQMSSRRTVSNTNCPPRVDFPEPGILFASVGGPSGHTCS